MTDVTTPTSMAATLNDLIVAHWAANDAPAVIGSGFTWSGEELCARALGLSGWLDDLGIAPGAPVPALLDESAEAVALAVGASLSGRALAPLGPRLEPAALTTAVRELGASVLVTEPQHSAVATAIAQASGVRTVDLTAARPRPPGEGEIRGGPDDVGAVIHTSGTTGRPKPVLMDHRRLVARTRLYADAVELAPGDAYCTASPWYHLAGMGMALLALGAGAATVPCAGFSRTEWRRVSALRPSHVLLVPTVIDMLLGTGDLGPAPRVLHYGASPMHASTLRAAMDALGSTRFVQIFGQTEVSPVCALTPDDHARAARGAAHLLGSVGRPLPEVELAIESADVDGVGEIAVRAPHTFVTDGDGWRRTGDLASVDDEGYVYLRGRRHDMVVRGGENIYPLEVERVLAAHPSVDEVCVLGRADRRWGEVVRAVVVARGEVTADELVEWARDRLAHFKVPTVIDFVEELPKTPSGKVLRGALA